MSIQENQTYINNKDWKSLASLDFFKDFNYGSMHINEYALTMEFVEEFFLSDLFGPKLALARGTISGVNLATSYVIKNIIGLIEVSDLPLSESNWKRMIDYLHTWVKNNLMVTSFIADCCTHDGKNSEWIKMLLNNPKIFEELVNIFKGIHTITPSQKIQNKLIQGLSDSELYKIPEILDFHSTVYTNFIDPPLLLKFFKTTSDCVEYFFEKFSLFRFKLGSVIRNLSQEEFYDILEATLRKGYTIDTRVIGEFSQYFKFNKDTPVKDFILDTLPNKKVVANQSIWSNVINNLTQEQLKEYSGNITASTLAKRDNISLKEIYDLLGDVNDNLSRSNIFTEEEIKNYPNFFDPMELSSRPSQYISPELFKLLNKTWSKRQKYNSDLTDFSKIMEYVSQDSLDSKKLGYLIQKTNASNSDVIRTLKNIYLQHNTSFMEKLNILKLFVTQYGTN